MKWILKSLCITINIQINEWQFMIQCGFMFKTHDAPLSSGVIGVVR